MTTNHPPTVYDSFTGIIPCKVLRVYVNPETGTKYIEARITVNRPAWTKGEIIHAAAFHFVPRRDVRKRKYMQVINTSHIWELTPTETQGQ